MKKTIDHILQAREKKITDEETVLQPLPHKDFRFANPFIVIHHGGPHFYKPGQQARIHPHPHRGFSPYTFMLQGEGFHQGKAAYFIRLAGGDVGCVWCDVKESWDEEKYPLGYGEPEDVAYPICFLLSDAAKWITGEVMVLDGGRTAVI